ncbi:MAG: carboxypeptidase regulatory-like domain-containing protein [Holophagaceae bacterium]|nr:carboxypeptidase regulatory-like domain-containing protein [Holophagaceae bacterium]
MIIRSLRKPSALVFILAAGVGLSAQEQGTLRGTILDTSGRPVPDVRVAISSPNMLQTRTVSTNARGEFVAPLLPTGTYTISISKSGYIGRRADNIRIGIGSSVSQNFTLAQVSEASATVDIAGEATGMVDKTETRMGTSYSHELINQLPVDRRFAGAANLAPGVVSGSSGLSIRGGSAANTMYRVDGSDVKDEYQNSQIGYGITPDNVEDVQVVLSELHARFGRSLGGAINVVTKSGSNVFSGSLRSNFDRNVWDGANRPYWDWYSVQYSDEEMYGDNLSRSWEATLNGPIWKDHIWFAFSTIQTPSDTYMQSISRAYGTNPLSTSDIWGPVQASTDPDDPVNSVMNAGPAGYMWSRMDEQKNYLQTRKLGRYDIKITGALSQNHTVDFSYSNEWDDLNGRNKFGDGTVNLSRLAALGDQSSVRQIYRWGYRGVLTSSLFLEAQYNKTDNTIQWPEGDMSYGGTNEYFRFYVGRHFTNGPYDFGGGIAFPFGNGSGAPGNLEERSNRSGNVNLKWITDIGRTSNEFDFGIDHFEGILRRDTQAGGQNFRIYAGSLYENLTGMTGSSQDDWRIGTVNYVGPNINGQTSDGIAGPALTRRNFLNMDGQNRNPGYAYYINDKITVNQHFNFMLGLRLQTSKVNDTDGTNLASTSFLSPRFQAKYDVKGDNAHVLGLTAARYAGDFQTQFTDSFVRWGSAVYASWGWSANPYEAYDLNDPTGQAGVRFVKYEDFYNMDNFQRIIDFGDVSKNIKLDPDLGIPYLDEFTLSYQRQWTNGASFSITYVNRTWYDTWAREQVYRPENLVTLTDPTGKGLPDQYAIFTRVFNSSDLVRDFQSLEIDFSARPSSRVLIGGNWTISRLTGNDNGGDGGGNWTDTSNTQYYLQYPHLAERGITRDDIAPYGPLASNQPQRGRFWAQYSLPVGQGSIAFSGVLNYNAAFSRDVTWWAPIDPAVPTFMRPDGAQMGSGRPVSYQRYANQSRGWLHNNDTYSTNFTISFNIPLGIPGWGSRVQATGEVNVYNVFNFTGGGTATSNNTVGSAYLSFSGASTGSPNRAWYPSNTAYWGANVDNGRWNYGLGNPSSGYRYVTAAFGLKF